MWKFLLGYYAYDSSHEERVVLIEKKKEDYQVLKTQWQVSTFYHNIPITLPPWQQDLLTSKVPAMRSRVSQMTRQSALLNFESGKVGLKRMWYVSCSHEHGNQAIDLVQ